MATCIQVNRCRNQRVQWIPNYFSFF